MKYSNCIDCNKEKLTYNQQVRPRCNVCSKLGTKRNAPSPLKGVALSMKTRNAMSLASGGDGKLEERRYIGHPGWAKAIKERDGECVHCHSKEKLEAHHLLRRSKYPQFALDMWNGLTLCNNCHVVTHGEIK